MRDLQAVALLELLEHSERRRVPDRPERLRGLVPHPAPPPSALSAHPAPPPSVCRTLPRHYHPTTVTARLILELPIQPRKTLSDAFCVFKGSLRGGWGGWDMESVSFLRHSMRTATALSSPFCPSAYATCRGRGTRRSLRFLALLQVVPWTSTPASDASACSRCSRPLCHAKVAGVWPARGYLVAEEGGLIVEAASERLDGALALDGAQRANHAHPLRQRLRPVQQPFLLPHHARAQVNA